MIIELVVGQLFLMLYNFANSFIDAYKILDNKTIAHSINFILYLIFAILLCIGMRIPFNFLFGWLPVGPGMLFLLSAFFNRQFSFDIPLNLRRGLAWDYQSTANPPKSITDRIERAIFGTGGNAGKKIAKAYAASYMIIIASWIFVL